MTIPENPTLDIEESVERQEVPCSSTYFCYQSRLHIGPFRLAMWRYVERQTKKRTFRKDASGYLCEKCVQEFGAYPLPERK